MALVLPHSVFLHLPKTGGTWIRAACRRGGLRGHESGPYNGSDLGTGRPRRRKRFTFTFVRHPLGWYRSLWAAKQRIGWDRRNPFERECASDDFAEFVRRAVIRWPGRYSRAYCRRFVGYPQQRIDFVGRYEHLADDLVQALTLAGETFDERRLRATPPQRVTGRLPKFQRRTELPEDLKQDLLQAEAEVIERFYATGDEK